MFIVRNRYHTGIKLACKLNLLPQKTISMIPKSTLHRFRSSDYSGIFGIELAGKLESNELLIKELLQCQTALTVSKGIIQIKNIVIKIKECSLSSFERMKEIVAVIALVKDSTGLDTALNEFSISRSTYHSWAFQVNHRCFDSFISKCVKRWPNQLSLSSIKKMKALSENEMFRGWPVVSIAHFAKRSGILDVSVHTWYKYTKLMGISAKPPRCLKKQKTGIRTDRPHVYWHADVTLFRTLDNAKAYIYFVVDNYSRAILSWRVSLKLSALTRLDTIKEAYERYVNVDAGDQSQDVQLIVDGGSENNNLTVDGYINSSGISIKKIIAQQDIIFSNSIVEAVNKIVKYRSLFLADISDIHTLQKHLEKFIPIHNEQRPHCSLKGLTPSEVLSGLRPDNIEHLKSVNLININKIIHNKNTVLCTECSKK